MNRRHCFGLAGSLLLLATARAADPALTITWDQLAPKPSAADNPFAALSEDQLELLVDVASVRDRKARGIEVSPQDVAAERAAAAKLKAAKIDVDGLLARRQEIAAKQRALAKSTNPALDGQLIRMPGYLLPLEYAGKQVAEFLLVPWVGACIHTPPPPPNQIVYVKAARPFDLSASFEAVWVTGRIATKGTKRSLQLVDGSSDVDVGYSMASAQVEPYR